MHESGTRSSLLTPALLGWAAGTALQLFQPSLWAAASYGACAALALALLATCRACHRWLDPRSTPAWVFAASLILAIACTGARALVFISDALHPALEGRDILVTGTIAALPQRSETGLRFRFDVEDARAEGHPVRLPPHVLAGWYAEDARSLPPVRAGDRWRFTLRPKAPHGTVNPHGFDFELWLWEQGLQATASVRAGHGSAAPLRLAAGWAHPVERARQSVRDAIFERVEDRRAAGLVAALVVGDQASIDRADWDVYRATGVAHLMSISGLHVTMFAWAASLLVGAGWRRSTRLCLRHPAAHAGALGGLAFAALYALFSGWGVPAQRTVLMLAAVTLLRLSGRRWPWPHVALLAFAVVTAADPWALLQAGFWLSFVAVGVLFASGGPGAAPGVRAGRWQLLRRAAREQVAVTVALAPLTLVLFSQVSLVGLLANAIAIPWVTLVVTPLAMAGVLLPAAWEFATTAIGWLDAVLQPLAAWPAAVLSLPTAPAWAGACGVAGGLLLVLPLPVRLRALGLPLLVPVLAWQVPRPAPGEFELLAADVGQGNAVIVRTAAHTLVYDTGPRYGPESDAGHRVLVPLLRALGERVDVVMLSHRDADHTGGAAAVLAMQPQARLTGSIEPRHELQRIRWADPCLAGQRWTWDGVAFEVLHPQPPDPRGAKTNAMSCVLRVTAADGAAALLPGDAEQPQEARLVAGGAALRADFLLVPHHGSKTSSGEAFLQAVRPRIALAQAGYRNRFGHPAPAVVQRYAALGIPLADSPHCGAARWHSARPGTVACERDRDRRYWRHVVP